MAKKNDFLSQAELAEARKLTRKSRGSHGLPANATSVEKSKYELCKQMIIYMQKHDISQRELAKKLGVSESRVSEIVHYNIRKITIDKLVELHERLKQSVVIKVMAA